MSKARDLAQSMITQLLVAIDGMATGRELSVIESKLIELMLVYFNELNGKPLALPITQAMYDDALRNSCELMQ